MPQFSNGNRAPGKPHAPAHHSVPRCHIDQMIQLSKDVKPFRVNLHRSFASSSHWGLVDVSWSLEALWWSEVKALKPKPWKEKLAMEILQIMYILTKFPSFSSVKVLAVPRLQQVQGCISAGILNSKLQCAAKNLGRLAWSSREYFRPQF